MSIRRHLLPVAGVDQTRETSPRKATTYNYPRDFIHNPGVDNLNRYVGSKHNHYIPKSPTPESKFRGKYFVPDGYRPQNPCADNYVTEKEIALFARPNIYQVIFASSAEDWISKPESYLRPGRMNLIVDPRDYKILDVEYF